MNGADPRISPPRGCLGELIMIPVYAVMVPLEIIRNILMIPVVLILGIIRVIGNRRS
jgi:hypothetical protein